MANTNTGPPIWIDRSKALSLELSFLVDFAACSSCHDYQLMVLLEVNRRTLKEVLRRAETDDELKHQRNLIHVRAEPPFRRRSENYANKTSIDCLLTFNKLNSKLS